VSALEFKLIVVSTLVLLILFGVIDKVWAWKRKKKR
jgi:hypothetical protein